MFLVCFYIGFSYSFNMCFTLRAEISANLIPGGPESEIVHVNNSALHLICKSFAGVVPLVLPK